MFGAVPHHGIDESKSVFSLEHRARQQKVLFAEENVVSIFELCLVT